MIHAETNQLVIGPYFIDQTGKVRSVSRQDMPGRLTAITRHLTDPAHKVLFWTQEGSVYEVDVQTLSPTLLFKKPVPGWHGKGAYTAQGVVVVSNNGEEPAPSPFWTVDYSVYPTSVQKANVEVSKYLQVPNTTGPKDLGVLAEWNGKQWSVISRRQYTEVTGPGGLRGAQFSNEPIWATGWDGHSLLLSVRDTGKWKHYRFLKPSYSLEGPNGSYTEWPRIRSAGQGRYLAFMNGGLFDFPATFSHRNTRGLRPINSLLRTITDWDTFKGELVFSSQETSVHGIQYSKTPIPGQPQSNLHFTTYEQLRFKGPKVGWGGVWKADTVKANVPSDPLHVGGYQYRTLHLSQKGSQPVQFTLEIDRRGTDKWTTWQTLTLAPNGYTFRQLPADLPTEWIRVRSNLPTVATAYLHGWSPRTSQVGEADAFAGLSKIEQSVSLPQAIIRPGFPTRNLQVLVTDIAGKQTYYEVDEQLTFQAKTDTVATNLLNSTHSYTAEVIEDSASVIVQRFDGKRFRLPKGPTAFSNKPYRHLREVVQERYLGHLHGTFYEIPRYGTGGRNSVNMPDYIRMKPVASHRLAIGDYMTWRGLLVLTGVAPNARPDEHVFRSNDATVGLWFGEVDDLWKLGKPVGTGGPWKNTAVQANVPSDPYLMTGYDKKVAEFSHDSKNPVKFRIELDFLANGDFYEYKSIEVPAGKTISYQFPDGFSAHWVRLVPDVACKATAIFMYQ